MANFSFDSLANVTGVASDKRLRPYSINKVKFVDAKVDKLHSEKNGGQDYDVFKIRFEGEHGYYEENIFLPATSGRDTERTSNNWGGENPSNCDRVMMFFAHTLSVINHDGFEKLKKVISKAKTFIEVGTIVAKFLMEKKDTEVYLKLAGRNTNGTVYASLPFYTAINKDSHEAYVNNNFLSLKDDLSFTANEDNKRREYENAKPTEMKNDTSIDIVSTSDNSDIDAATADDLTSMLAEL